MCTQLTFDKKTTTTEKRPRKPGEGVGPVSPVLPVSWLLAQWHSVPRGAIRIFRSLGEYMNLNLNLVMDRRYCRCNDGGFAAAQRRCVARERCVQFT